MKTQQDKDYITFLENVYRLYNSMSYAEAQKIAAYDVLGTAAMIELRRLNDENS